jgi:hypothetical protein
MGGIDISKLPSYVHQSQFFTAPVLLLCIVLTLFSFYLTLVKSAFMFLTLLTH